MEREHLSVMLRDRVERYGDKVAFRYRDSVSGQWRETSWAELGEMVRAVAKGLFELGARKGDRIGIFSQNRQEWAIADYGIQTVRAVSVPIYATNSAAQARFIVENAGIEVLFAGDGEQFERAKAVASEGLRKIIVFADNVAADDADSRVMTLGALMELGRRSQRDEEIDERLAKASQQDLATIIYTSGTTGAPKGVMLLHSNFFHQLDVVGRLFDVTVDDVSLCFLPLSHVFERAWSYFVVHQGAENCYCDDPRKVLEYIQAVRPTVMVAVPRLYEKVRAGVMDRLRGFPPRKQRLFLWALDTGRALQERKAAGGGAGIWLKLRHMVADRLVLGKIRSLFGGRMRFLVSGGAPLAREIAEFFQSIGIFIFEGYGLTETSPVITCNCPGVCKIGTVGKVVPRCEVKLSEDGEILVRGDNVTPGYNKNPEATAQAFEEGWFRTGDVGELDSEGFLKITDRIKDLIITSGGKNISPQNVQACLMREELIEQALVIGDGRSFVSALIVPSFEALEDYAGANGIRYSSREELVRMPEIVALYERRIAEHSRELGDYEKVKKFRLLAHEFTQETGEMTPTLKLKRNVIFDKYSDLINSMYEP